jgi:CDP-diacylglycerol--glycerol-3-phosphate 3-phosphatidyltransferase
MMHSKLGAFLVASRFMRGLYGLAKGAAFVGLALGSTISALGPEALERFASVIWAEQALVYLAAALCILRGLPVLWDIRSLLGKPPETEA